MRKSIRRNNEGIEFLVLEPSSYVTETQGLVVIVGDPTGDFIPHTAYAVPLYAPGIACDQLINGSASINFTALPDGVCKAGFPYGQDSEEFTIDGLRQFLESGLFDLDKGRVDVVVGLCEEFTNCDTKALKAEANLNFWNFLVGRPEIACMIPSIFAGFIGALDADVAEVEGLDTADVERFHDLSRAISSEDHRETQIYIKPAAIKALWTILPDYVIAPSETIRRLKAIVGIQLMGALSNASTFSRLHNATERDIDKVIEALV
jgi:hypothetical protein